MTPEKQERPTHEAQAIPSSPDQRATASRVPNGVDRQAGADAWGLGIDRAGVVHDLVADNGSTSLPVATIRARCGMLLPGAAAFGDRDPEAMCPECARFRHGHETSICWDIADPFSLDYVRVWTMTTKRRTGRPRWPFATFELLGWADLGPGAQSMHGRFTRRVFVRKAHDRRPGVVGTHYVFTAPCEAVDPLTIAPNVVGWKTQRSWGEPC